MQWKQSLIAFTLTFAVLMNVGSTDERELATRALSESPANTVFMDGRSREVQDVSEPPEGIFQITAVTFAVKKPAFPESIFDNLAKIPHLTEIKYLDLGVRELLTKRAVKRLRKQLSQCRIEYSKDLPRLRKR